MTNLLKILLIILVAQIGMPQQVQSCTIFIANDGKNVWVGNNEDDSPSKNYRLWFVPAKTNENGYIVWGGILPGLVERMSAKFPEGGMNESGLFIDAAALPAKMPITTKNAAKKNWNGYVVRDVLKKCKTVQEALVFLNQYNLVDQEKAQIFIADATGDYAIVHANYVIKKETANFALTNYCLTDGKEHLCWRRNIVGDMLKTKMEFGLSDIRSMMEKSAQTDYFNKTNFSIAADLKAAQLHVFQKRDFTTDKTLSIKEELQKGERSEDMLDIFPKNVALELEKTVSKKGIAAAVEQYKQLKNATPNVYNFNNNDVVNFAVELLGQGKISEAKALLQLNTEFKPDNTAAQLWLGVAAKLSKDDQQSTDLYADLLKKEPKNYLVNLFGNQTDTKVSFYLDHFEDAKTVYLAGDFTDWKAKAIEMKKENGVWFCSLTIPKGEHQYKFIVEDVWMTDPKNGLLAIEKKNVNSKLIVW